MTLNKYSTFRNRTTVNTESTKLKTSDFIENSASSVDALRESTNENIKAVIISERKEGGDEIILFTYSAEDVQIGEYITYKNKTYLTYSEYNITFTDTFKKHKLLECNTTLKWSNNIQKAYYISSLRKYASLSDLSDTDIPYQFSSQKPIIITSQNSELKSGNRFIINGEAFIIEDIDKISNQGIFYLSVSQSNAIEGVDDIENEETYEVPASTNEVLVGDLIAGSEETLDTNFGYTSFSHDVDIISKTMNSVTFEVPVGIANLVVETKDSLGNIIINEYRVVIE